MNFYSFEAIWGSLDRSAFKTCHSTVSPYKKSLRYRRPLKTIGAAYRIRTYDVLIRSQTLYPAEVTPQRTDYYARDPSMGQATIWKNFYGAPIKPLAPRPRFESMLCLPKRKAPVSGGFQVQLVRRIGFRASASRIRTGFGRLPASSPAG